MVASKKGSPTSFFGSRPFADFCNCMFFVRKNAQLRGFTAFPAFGFFLFIFKDLDAFWSKPKRPNLSPYMISYIFIPHIKKSLSGEKKISARKFRFSALRRSSKGVWKPCQRTVSNHPIHQKFANIQSPSRPQNLTTASSNNAITSNQ